MIREGKEQSQAATGGGVKRESWVERIPKILHKGNKFAEGIGKRKKGKASRSKDGEAKCGQQD